MLLPTVKNQRQSTAFGRIKPLFPPCFVISVAPQNKSCILRFIFVASFLHFETTTARSIPSAATIDAKLRGNLIPR